MTDAILQFLLGIALGFGVVAYIAVIINGKRLNNLEKKLQDKVIDIYAAVVHDDNLLENDIKELKGKITFLASTNDVRLINKHINRIETRIDRLAEIINGKRRVK